MRAIENELEKVTRASTAEKSEHSVAMCTLGVEHERHLRLLRGELEATKTTLGEERAEHEKATATLCKDSAAQLQALRAQFEQATRVSTQQQASPLSTSDTLKQVGSVVCGYLSLQLSLNSLQLALFPSLQLSSIFISVACSSPAVVFVCFIFILYLFRSFAIFFLRRLTHTRYSSWGRHRRDVITYSGKGIFCEKACATYKNATQSLTGCS
jgi:hypothetical protein